MTRYIFAYRCPECAGTFKWPQHEVPPDRCPLCKAWVSDDEPAEFVPKAPAIRKSPYTKSVDQTYRAIEEQSIARADEAASLLESEYARNKEHDHLDGFVAETQKEQLALLKSELKITNMKDPSQMREGDTAVIGRPSVDLSVAQGAGFQSYGGPVSAGKSTSMADFASRSTVNHSSRAISMIRNGNQGMADSAGRQILPGSSRNLKG